MIKLYQPGPVWGLPSLSPFCVKLETYLRMAKIEYKNYLGLPQKAPKGKIPYIELDGQLVGDSGIIIDLLEEKFGNKLDGHLTQMQRAQCLALRRLIEEHLYFAGLWLRWSDPQSLHHVREYFLNFLPKIIGPLIFKKIRGDVISAAFQQGMGRHTREQIIKMAKDDLNAISVLLGKNNYFMGDRISSIDAVAYGFLIMQLDVPWTNEVKEHAMSLQNLVDFVHRIKKEFW